MTKFSEIFGETIPQRVFWISLWSISLSLIFGGTWLFVKMLEELARLL